MNNFVYDRGGNLYINLTNKCSNNCSFCIRHNHDGINGKNLWLDREPTAKEVIDLLPQNLCDFNEVVFCGFGEPTYKPEVMREVGLFVKSKGQKTRVNTNGQANLVFGKDVTPLLKGAIDVVNVSLNASNAQEYQKICHSKFGEKAFDAMLDFAVKCRDLGMDVIMSVVDVIGEKEVEACRKLCLEKGLKLRVRNFE